MDDLVARLRAVDPLCYDINGSPVPMADMLDEAADEIEHLRAENAALRAVMRNVIDWSDDYIEIKLREEMEAARMAQQPVGG